MLIKVIIILGVIIGTFLLYAVVMSFLSWYYWPERYIGRKFKKNLGATVAYGMNISKYAKRRPKLKDAFIVGIKIDAPLPSEFNNIFNRIRNVRRYGEIHVTYEFCIKGKDNKIVRNWSPSIMIYTDKRMLLTERSLL